MQGKIGCYCSWKGNIQYTVKCDNLIHTIAMFMKSRTFKMSTLIQITQSQPMTPIHVPHGQWQELVLPPWYSFQSAFRWVSLQSKQSHHQTSRPGQVQYDNSIMNTLLHVTTGWSGNIQLFMSRSGSSSWQWYGWRWTGRDECNIWPLFSATKIAPRSDQCNISFSGYITASDILKYGHLTSEH